MAEQEHADPVDEGLVGEQIAQHVGVEAAAGEHADRAVEALGDVAGGLQRFPTALHEMAMLGVHDRRVALPDPEELRVEGLEVVEHSRPRDVVGVAELPLWHVFGSQDVARQVDEAVLAGGHPAPELVDVRRSGEPSGHPDDGDVGVGIAGVVGTVVGHRSSPCVTSRPR